MNKETYNVSIPFVISFDSVCKWVSGGGGCSLFAGGDGMILGYKEALDDGGIFFVPSADDARRVSSLVFVDEPPLFSVWALFDWVTYRVTNSLLDRSMVVTGNEFGHHILCRVSCLSN